MAAGTSDLDTFRRETADWLKANAPGGVVGLSGTELEGNWGGRRPTFINDGMKQWLEIMGEKGWTAPTWPTEYGGGGLSGAEAKVLSQEMRAQKLPAPLIGFGLTMIGPTLLRFGTEEQKKQHLPAICRGEIRWCQGYSEPGAGSDLASLQTKAVRDGDDFIINGQKIWTSYADEADWIFALVRTDARSGKKQDGITFMLIDMESPGVSVKPIQADQRQVALLRDLLRRRAGAGQERDQRDRRRLDGGQGAARPRALHDRRRLRRHHRVAPRRRRRGQAGSRTWPRATWAKPRAASPTRPRRDEVAPARWTPGPSGSPCSGRATRPRPATSPAPRARSSRSTRPSSTSGATS